MKLKEELHKVIEINDGLRDKLEEEKQIKNFEVLKRIPSEVLLKELLKRIK